MTKVYGLASSPRWNGRACAICSEPIEGGEWVYTDGRERLFHQRHGDPNASPYSQSTPGRVTLTIRGTT